VADIGLVTLTDRVFGPWALEAWPSFSDSVLAAVGKAAGALACRPGGHLMEIGPGIRRLGKGLVNSYLVETDGEVTIVDAGAPVVLGRPPAGAGGDGPHA
jgi:hypothetical protein